LARREAAIVSPYPGTTRDVIEVHLDLAGYPVTLLDTAGIRVSDDPVEQEGIRRATARAAAADLVLWVIDSQAIEHSVGDVLESVGKSDNWVVYNKADLAGDKLWINSESRSVPFTRQFAISAATGVGIEALVGALSIYAQDYFAATESVLVTRARHRQALEETVAALDRALGQGVSGQEELIAEELRAAATILGRLTGRVDVEDILDVIFRDFCIGK
jgi:tRNA modification GTPase